MFPVLVLSRSTSVGTWGLLVSLAAVAVLWLGRLNAPARGLSAESVESLWPWLMLGGFGGAHLYHLVAVSGWPLRAASSLGVWNIFSGTAVQGGFLGGACAAAIYLRWKGLPLLPYCDALSPGGALAQAFTRLGCFAAGCCYGRPTKLFLGVVFTSPFADPGVPRGVPLHPAQLYEAILDAGLAALLQSRLKIRSRPGVLFSHSLIGASLIRFVVQFFRDDDSGRLIAGLAHSQFTALAMLAGAVALWRQIGSKEELI